MTHTVSGEIRLNNRPEGMPQQNDFELVKWKETVVNGIENAPKAFIGLFKGENFVRFCCFSAPCDLEW